MFNWVCKIFICRKLWRESFQGLTTSINEQWLKQKNYPELTAFKSLLSQFCIIFYVTSSFLVERHRKFPHISYRRGSKNLRFRFRFGTVQSRERIRNYFVLSPTIKDNFDSSVQVLRRIRRPMVPLFDQFVKSKTRTLRRDELPMGIDLVIGYKFLKLHAFFHEQKSRL